MGLNSNNEAVYDIVFHIKSKTLAQAFFMSIRNRL